jgi:hypothetical protein
VLLPASWRDRPREDVRLALLHEAAHVRRRDNVLHLFQRLVECALFFHPLVRLAGRKLTDAREQLCDEAAAGEDVRAYATMLHRIAADLLHPRPAPAVAMAHGALRARVAHILEVVPAAERPARRVLRRVLAVTAMMLLGAGGLVRLEARPAEEAEVRAKSTLDSAGADAEEAAPVGAEAEGPEETYEEWLAEDEGYLADDGPGADALRLPTAEEKEKLGPLWPDVPASENAALLYMNAARRVSEIERIPGGSASSDEPWDGDVEAFAEWVALNEEAVALARKAAELDVCRLPTLMEAESGTPRIAGAHLARLRHLARCLSDAAFLAEVRGEFAKAADIYLTMMRMGEHLRSQGLMLEHLVGQAIGSIGREHLTRLVAHAELGDDALRRIDARLREMEIGAEDVRRMLDVETHYRGFLTKPEHLIADPSLETAAAAMRPPVSAARDSDRSGPKLAGFRSPAAPVR